MSEPRISVVIPVHNGARYLGEALESVSWQTLQPAEIIVVDDGSTDCSGAIAGAFAGVRVVQQVNSGPSVARNVGVAACSSEIIAFLDADDIWLPDKLELQLAALLEHASLGYVIGQLRTVLSDGAEVPPSYRAEALGKAAPGPIPSLWFLRRATLEQVGEFNPELRVSEDVEWIGRAKRLGVISREVPHVLALRRIHDANISMATVHGNSSLLRALRASLPDRSGDVRP